MGLKWIFRYFRLRCTLRVNYRWNILVIDQDNLRTKFNWCCRASHERRRREHRRAKGAEWGRLWGGVSPPQPTKGLGERRELPQRGPGRIAIASEFFFSVPKITHEPLYSARWNSARTYLDNHTNPIAFQGYRSKVKVTGPDYRIFHHCEIGQNKFVSTITHEPLHSGWWYFKYEDVPRQPREPIKF